MPLRFFCALFFCQKFNKSFIICVETQSAANFRSAYLHQQQQCWSNTLHATGQLLTTFRTSIDTFTACWCVCRCVYFLFLSNFVDFVPSCFTIVCRNFDHLTVLAHSYRLISYQSIRPSASSLCNFRADFHLIHSNNYIVSAYFL